MSLPRWFTCSRPKNGRSPQNVKKVPFKEAWPLVLQNFVSTRKGRQNEAPCLKETLSFISCLKDNNNLQEMCIAESKAVQDCYGNHLVAQQEARRR
ncbi:hypothetical protein X975_25549, partial [Stegodyphus mimosarum]